jgi:hypothetical protein
VAAAARVSGVLGITSTACMQGHVWISSRRALGGMSVHLIKNFNVRGSDATHDGNPDGRVSA